MPMIELTYPKGALAAAARAELLDELATKLLEAERAPDTEFFRSITWVYANEIDPETLAVGGRPEASRASASRSRSPRARCRIAARESSSARSTTRCCERPALASRMASASGP